MSNDTYAPDPYPTGTHCWEGFLIEKCEKWVHGACNTQEMSNDTYAPLAPTVEKGFY